MKRLIIISVSSLLSIWAIVCSGYEPDTHALLSDDAASNSVINSTAATPTIPTTVLQDLGIGGYNADTFPDIQSGQTVDSGPGLFPPKFEAITPGSVQNLIKTGAELEDANDRAFCHFYDPVYGSPLNFTFAGTPYSASFTAPQWATGSTDSTLVTPITGTCTVPGIPGLSPEQQDYSLLKANQYLYDALTKQNKSDRDQNFGNLFLSIGHVLHLLEDMGQPQHVRDDLHCDSAACLLVGRYAPSEYEKYAYRNYDTSSPDYTNTPDFPASSQNSWSFWFTGDQKGLAEYTNMNFVSIGTMDSLTNSGGSGKYPLPAPSGTTNVPIASVFSYIQGSPSPTLPSQIGSYCQTRNCTMTFITSQVNDVQAGTPAVTNPWAASQSIFNADLNDVNNHQFYALNAATYKSDESFLLKKVRSYSAGLINHFFRGRLNVTYDQTTPNSYIVTNVSNYAMQNGTLTVYYDAADGTRTLVPGATYPSQNFDAYCTSGCNDSISISFQPPTNPAPKNANEYIFVYQGTIGTELGVAGFDLKPPVVHPGLMASVYEDLVDNAVTIFDDSGNQLSSINLGFTPCTQQGNSCGNPGLPPTQFTIYGGMTYTANTVGSYTYPPNSRPVQFVEACNGVVQTSPNHAIAANNFGVFVSESGICSGVNGLDIYQYGFRINHSFSSSNPDRVINIVPHSPDLRLSSTSLSMNNSVMCITYSDYYIVDPILGVDGPLDNEAVLADMQGNVLMSLSLGSDVDTHANCASTGNRHYILVGNALSGSTTLYVYDNGGALLTTYDMGNCQCDDFDSGEMVATENKLYFLPYQPLATSSFNVDVLSRVVTRDSNGGITSETFTPQNPISVIVPGFNNSTLRGGNFRSLGIDMFGVLNGPIQ